jgi:hypothetical protein
MASAVSGTEAIRTWDDHRIGTAALAKKFNTNIDTGLTSAQAKSAHAEYGDNALTKKESVPWYCLFLQEMVGIFSLLLWFGSALCFIGFFISKDKEDKSNLYLGLVLAIVTFLTGCFSYAQSSKSAEMMAQFENFIPPIAYVVRDGKETKVDAKYIVPGDIVMVKGGENIPCDICIFRSNEMKVNNASLTGESEDIQIDPDLEPIINIFETKNVGFFGTQCTAGTGSGISSEPETPPLSDKSLTWPLPLSLPKLHFPLRSIDSSRLSLLSPSPSVLFSSSSVSFTVTTILSTWFSPLVLLSQMSQKVFSPLSQYPLL